MYIIHIEIDKIALGNWTNFASMISRLCQILYPSVKRACEWFLGRKFGRNASQQGLTTGYVSLYSIEIYRTGMILKADKRNISDVFFSPIRGTTFLAILPLAFSSSQAFRVFFKMFFGIVVAGGTTNPLGGRRGRRLAVILVDIPVSSSFHEKKYPSPMSQRNDLIWETPYVLIYQPCLEDLARARRSYKWRFPEMGLPPVLIHFWDFFYKPSILGPPIYGNPHMMFLNYKLVC